MNNQSFSNSKDFRALIPAAVALRDCVFLSLVLLISLILYIRGLGFYGDDWGFFGAMSHSASNSLIELFRALVAYEAYVLQRPLQGLHLAWMYRLFDTNPLGYHLTNSAVFIAAMLLFYLALRELKLPRLVVLTVPLIYGLLPHYSTDRFWVAAFQANLSMGLYFASLYADIRMFRKSNARRWGWKLLSIACLLGSGLAYEVALPLFLLNIALIVWLQAQKPHTSNSSDLKKRIGVVAMTVSGNLMMLLLVVGYKAATTLRAGEDQTGYVLHLFRIIKKAAYVDYISLGIALPYVTGKVFSEYADPVMLFVSALFGTLIFVYLYHVAGELQDDTLHTNIWLTFFVLSPIVYFLGYAIFVTTPYFYVHKTGIANRVAIAAAIGVAMTFAGGIGLANALMPSAWLRKTVLPSAVTLLCLCGFLIINANAKFWIAAYREQQQVIADIRTNIPPPPTDSALILDGVCPYIGSGIVFESFWDLAGELKIIYNNPKLRADVVKPNLEVNADGLNIRAAGFVQHYQYGDNLLLYDFRRKAMHKLVNAEAARRYMETRDWDHSSDCPAGREGAGVSPF